MNPTAPKSITIEIDTAALASGHDAASQEVARAFHLLAVSVFEEARALGHVDARQLAAVCSEVASRTSHAWRQRDPAWAAEENERERLRRVARYPSGAEGCGVPGCVEVGPHLH